MATLDDIMSKLSPERKALIEAKAQELIDEEVKARGHTGPLPSVVVHNRKQIENAIETLTNQLNDLRNHCQHVNCTYEAKGSTGSYDRDDIYWYSWKCDDCGKYWTTEQKQSEVKKYPFAKRIIKI